jgi:hypothetical protein
VDDAKIITVPLDTPLDRPAGQLEQLRFRKPVSGDLRGMSIAKLGQLDYDEQRKLLARITLDGLIEAEIDKLDVCDQLQISNALMDFLVPKRQLEAFQIH